MGGNYETKTGTDRNNAVACRGLSRPQNTANPFTDVLEGKYYYDAVLWAVENRVTTGTAATRFSPNETCTRAQIVTFCGGIWERLRRRSRLLPLRI